MKKYLVLMAVAVWLCSCSDYQKLLKSSDADLKYEKAVEYFDKGDYMRAQTLFDEVTAYYRGTERSETLLNYIARSYMGQKDYYSATEYYKAYVRTYPKGQYAEEAKFMIGYCYYLDSPDARLDQTSTQDAINELQEFVDIYPENERVPEANSLIEELRNKLAYKELLNARLYYNLGNYLGNNYLSAVIVAQNALENYPETTYREDLSMVILQSRYQQAVQSVAEKKQERFIETIDEYYSFINEFPEGKYRRQADRILREARKVVPE